MAFNSRKFQKLMDEERNNTSFADEFEDDFADDFNEEPAEEVQAEPADLQPETEEVSEFEPVAEEEPAAEEEPVIEEVTEEAPVEEPAEEAVEELAEEVAEEPVAVAVSEPEAEEPAEEVYDAHKMWQDMAALAVRAKECINAGAFFRANDIITAMRSMLVEMMCRANGINEDFNNNADNLSEECKQDIYTSYAATLNAQSLSNAVTNIMAVTYKYI